MAGLITAALVLAGLLDVWTARRLSPLAGRRAGRPTGLLHRRVAATLGRHRVRADHLVLEINEDALLGEAAVSRTLTDQLRRAGVQLWLDDFGTGYSSLLSPRRISSATQFLVPASAARAGSRPRA